MPTIDIIDEAIKRARLEDAALHSSASPTTPTEPFTGTDSSPCEQSAKRSDTRQSLADLGSQRKLIIAAAIVGALVAGVPAYTFWPAASDVKQCVASVQVSTRRPEPALSETTPALSETTTALSETTTVGGPDPDPRQSAPSTQNQEIVFLLRPGVKIRSTPATNGGVLPRKGTRFKVEKRDGNWVQVESDPFKGWIRSEFLGPNEPR